MSLLPASSAETFELSGEIDCARARDVEADLRRAFADGVATVDVSGLTFIDTAGMRAIAVAAGDAGQDVFLVGASYLIRHCWRMAGFDTDAPGVHFVD